ncbi:hypothetical protein OG943_03640 [Amycolatopsis sp. NBC_00345]|uniref:VOC family protein n=1 Tax=Amycolatopsis sp. NBC_00345 TaxID=2975955 RepID=UPI002E25FA3F
MIRLGTVVLGVDDMGRALAFWRQALSYVLRDGEPGEEFTVLVPPDGGGFGLSLQLSGSPVQELPRVHVDLYAGSAEEHAAEWSLVSLGACLVSSRPRRRYSGMIERLDKVAKAPLESVMIIEGLAAKFARDGAFQVSVPWVWSSRRRDPLCGNPDGVAWPFRQTWVAPAPAGTGCPAATRAR